jgi:hypothetical protein
MVEHYMEIAVMTHVSLKSNSWKRLHTAIAVCLVKYHDENFL